jgi:F-type H+-transporting ATPase subunit gamma
MEMVAASKMRRAQAQVLAARPYAEKMGEVLANLAAQPRSDTVVHPLLEEREESQVTIIHVTADRGLCGGLNANMNRQTGNLILEQQSPTSLVTVGRRGRDFMVRYGRDIRAEFSDLPDYPSLLDIAPIARIVIDDYTNGVCDRVFLAYSRFVSTVNQQPTIRQLLPVEPASFGEDKSVVEYIYEPSSQDVLTELLPRYIEMQVYHAVLEGIASEQSARMVAMRNATESANEMIEDLTLSYNKARQAMITKELLEIVAGAEALR